MNQISMVHTLRRALVLAAVGLIGVAAASPAVAAGAAEHPPAVKWSFAGMFGHYDPGQLQRGFKIYREVCSSCHSLSLPSFRNLAEPGGPGFTEGQARTIAAEYQIQDGPDAKGEMFERPGRLSDQFPRVYPNDEAARAANNGALPPDMSLLAKARTYERGFPTFVFDIATQYQEQGPDYIHALLNGYEEPPAGVKPLQQGLHYNKYFPGHWIAMGKPLQDGQVEYTDGAPTTLDQYGKDLAAFLMWAAEPHLTERKHLGFVVLIYLAIFAGLLYFVKKKVWRGWDEGRAA